MSKYPGLRPDLKGKVAIITGATRGIGRECALTLARLGCRIVVAAKTTEPNPKLPGTIYSVAQECKDAHPSGMYEDVSLAFKIDLRNAESCVACVEATVAKFGRVDILINNASALWWQPIEKTPLRKYDLITQVNVRGTFAMTAACLPYMRKNNFGRVVTMSPPIRPDIMKDKTAYYVSKMGMTMVAMGVAAEYKGKNITGNSLWPATVIESYASINFKLGERRMWRKAQILADCVAGLVGGDTSGEMLYDEDYLRRFQGFTDEDLVQYRCDPRYEPPKVLLVRANGFKGASVNRGDVRKVDDDRRDDRLRAKM